MRVAGLIPFCILFSCAGNGEVVPETDPTDSLAVVVDTSLNPIEEPAVVLNEKSTVRDYADHFLKADIADRSDPDDFCRPYFLGLDIPNRYAEVVLPCSNFSETYTFKTWTSENGSVIVGKIAAYVGMTRSYDCNFYDINGGEVSQVEDVVLPMKRMNEHKEEMDKRMREKHNFESADYLRFTFHPADDIVNVDIWYSELMLDLPLFTLEWEEDKFEIKKKFDKIPKVDKY